MPAFRALLVGLMAALLAAVGVGAAAQGPAPAPGRCA